MDGTNSNGRRISLLNDDAPTYSFPSSKPSYPRNYSYSSQASSILSSPRSLTRLPSFQSRTSSSHSTPCLSPLTPHLIRSNSTDSTAEMQTPSPITPDFGYPEPLVAQQSAYSSDQAYFSKESFQYPQQQVASIHPSYPTSAQTAAYYHPQPSAESKSVSQPAQKSKKNQYPCPVAKQYNCSDYFTTSGHAARHAKKHTGKKDALCPDCNKAFTRKDNMEQHRRTHLNGRNASKGSEDKSRKVSKHLPKRPKPAPLLDSALSMVDPALPSLPISPTSTFTMTPTTQQSMDIFPAEYMQQQRHMYPDPSQCTINPGRFELQSPSYGLDTLAAAAASGEKRKYGE